MNAVNPAWRKRLLAMRAELQALDETGAGSAAVVELDQAKVGRLSRMDAMQAQAMAKASNQRRQQLMVGIAAALKRIDDGSYGICAGCDDAINPKRLEFDPTVIYCINCATSREMT